MKRFLLALALAIALTGASLGALWYSYDVRPLDVATGQTVAVNIPKGAGAAAVARRLRGAGIDVNPLLFRGAVRLRGDGGRLKAGTYQIHTGTTLHQLLDRLVAGDVVLEQIRFQEGWTFRQIREAIDAHPDLAHDSKALDTQALLKRLNLPYDHPEGLFFPNTYHFSKGASDLELLAQASELMRAALEDAWEDRAENLPLETPYQALILASIIEKETGRDEDRPMVASVFINRLRIGMMLQSDPTTIYGMGERFDGNLRRRDLRADTPYNTYTRNSLPPTPIAMPSKAAIHASLHPADSRALYFVSRGDGTTAFSENLKDHNRAVRRFQLRIRPKKEKTE